MVSLSIQRTRAAGVFATRSAASSTSSGWIPRDLAIVARRKPSGLTLFAGATQYGPGTPCSSASCEGASSEVKRILLMSRLPRMMCTADGYFFLSRTSVVATRIEPPTLPPLSTESPPKTKCQPGCSFTSALPSSWSDSSSSTGLISMHLIKYSQLPSTSVMKATFGMFGIRTFWR